MHPHRRTVFVSEAFNELPERFPVLMDIHTGWACTRDGDGIHMSGETDKTESFDRHIDWSHLTTSAEHALHRDRI